MHGLADRRGHAGIRVTVESWGRYPKTAQRVISREWRDEPLAIPAGLSVLAHGMGRSYGDSCLNDGNAVISTRRLRRILEFDPAEGVLRCEAGMTLDEILDFCVPRGWFPPVTPGTRFVTVGGAAANDVHGKNHHVAGCFGNFVRAMELLRGDGSRHVLHPGQDLFRATIAGLGLTGLIDWVEFQLKPIGNRWIDVETIRMGGLDEFFALSRESEPSWEYLVAWVDTVVSPGRGLFIRGNHDTAREPSARTAGKKPALRVPFDFPSFALGRFSIGAFNELFYRKQLRRVSRQTVDYEPFFYPLDSLLEWNRLYGKAGLLQWQCLVPWAGGPEAVAALLKETHRSGQASFLTVLKTMGSKPAAGMLSFAGPGITLALDFQRGGETLKLLDRLDSIIAEVGGRLYPAKDARMSGASFREFYPKWREFEWFRDPAFSSSFWRRVTEA